MNDKLDHSTLSRFTEVQQFCDMDRLIKLRFHSNDLLMLSWNKLFLPEIKKHVDNMIELGISEYHRRKGVTENMDKNEEASTLNKGV